jgi:low affinity Fe/Cu permease
MTTIVYSIFLLCAFLTIAFNFVNINELDKRIDEILAEEKRQNKRIDLLEKREQMRQVEQIKDQTYIQPRDLFEKW